MLAPLPPTDAEKVGLLRAQLPATDAGIYLNTSLAGPLPSETVGAMRELEDLGLRFGRGSPGAREELKSRVEEARAVVAALLRADPGEVALTHSAADGLATAVWAVDWRPGDEIVTTDGGHRGMLQPLTAVCDRFEVRLRCAPVGDGGDDERTLAAIQAETSSRTRLLAIPHVAPLTGAVLPVARIADLARRVGAWLAVDGAKAAGAIPLDVPALGADFYALPAQEWLLGPEGMGALWASPRVIAEARPGTAGHRVLDARRFDALAFHLPSVGGFARSVGWLEMHVGLDWVYERTARLGAWTANALNEIPGVEVLTPRDRMAAIVTFRVAGWTPEEANRALARRHFAILRTLPPLGALQASVGFFNTDAELARFVRGVAEVAATTPDSLPDRPELVVLPD